MTTNVGLNQSTRWTALSLATTMALLFLVLCPVEGGATTYCVKSTADGGNDSNTGIYPSSCWATVSKVNSFSATPGLLPGDSVLFEKGVTWRTMLAPHNPTKGSAGMPITFGVIPGGTGAAILNGSDIVSEWTQRSGDSNPVYFATLNTRPHAVYIDPDFTTPTWPLQEAACLDGGSCTVGQCPNTNECSIGPMAVGSWWWDGTSKLYVWLSDGTNPSSHSVQGSTRVASINLAGGGGTTPSYAYITVDGLTLVRGYRSGIYMDDNGASADGGMPGMVVKNCTVAQTGTGKVDSGYYTTIHFQDSSFSADGFQALNNNVSVCGSHGNCIMVQGDTGGPLVAGNEVQQWMHNGIDFKAVSGAIASGNHLHDTSGTNQPGIYIENTQLASGADVTFRDNTIWNTTTGLQCNTGGNYATTCNIYGNVVFNRTGLYDIYAVKTGGTVDPVINESGPTGCSNTPFLPGCNTTWTSTQDSWSCNPSGDCP